MSVSDWSGRARCVVLGEYLAEKKTTVRQAAAVFGVSKSTVHKDVTETLRFVNRPLWEEVRRVLLQNKEERHLPGGEAARFKYSALPGRRKE